MELCPHHFQKSNWNSSQNSTGILPKVTPNFLVPQKKEERTGFWNPPFSYTPFFKNLPLITTMGMKQPFSLHQVCGEEQHLLILSFIIDPYFCNV